MGATFRMDSEQVTVIEDSQPWGDYSEFRGGESKLAQSSGLSQARQGLEIPG